MHNTVTRHGLLILIAGLAACGGPAATTITASLTPRPGAAGSTAPVKPQHLWLEHAHNQVSQLAVLDTRSGSETPPMPVGVVAPNWSRMYAVTGGGAATVLRAIDPATGAVLQQVTVDVGFTLPHFGDGDRPTGLSPDGGFLVLRDQSGSSGAGGGHSSFRVYDTTRLTAAPVGVSLDGNFAFEAISNDGRNLYLLQLLNVDGDQDRYQVRRYDLHAGALDARALADEHGATEIAGAPISTAPSVDGATAFIVFGLGRSAPALVILSLSDGSLHRIDLPASSIDQGLDLLWGLAASHDGQFMYAVNAGTGVVLQMQARSPWNARRATFAVPSPAPELSSLPWQPTTAEAKRVVFGAAVISNDDHTLYAIADRGVLTLDTATLSTTSQHLLDAQPLTSLVTGSGGEQLYATSLSAATPLLQVNVHDGTWAAIDGAGRPQSVLHATR